MRNLFFLFILFIHEKLLCQSLLNNPNFNLWWNEEFNNGAVIDPRWTIANGLIDYSGGPNPLEMISTNNNSLNIWQSNGTIKLTTTFDSINHKLNRSAISAEVPMVQGGFFESKSRFKNGPQIMATFWIWSGDGKCLASAWQDYQEIDFLEYFGRAIPQHTSGGVHCCRCTCPNTNEFCRIDTCSDKKEISRNCRNGCNAHQNYEINSPDVWHIYSGSWRQQDGIRLYQDWGQKAARTNPTNMQTNWANKFIVLDTREQCWSRSDCMKDIKNYPYTYEVDYIRVFTLKTDCNEVITSIPNFSTFNYSVKKSITLTNTLIPSNITNDPVTGRSRNIALYATDFIELKGSVEFGVGASCELGIISCQ